MNDAPASARLALGLLVPVAIAAASACSDTNNPAALSPGGGLGSSGNTGQSGSSGGTSGQGNNGTRTPADSSHTLGSRRERGLDHRCGPQRSG